jgi:histone-lysine N-methyltransferase SETMAR
MEWRHSGSARPKIFRVQKSAGKVLASIFWDQDGILPIDYLPKGQTINLEYYSSVLVQLEDILKEKPRGNFTRESCTCTTMPPVHRTLAAWKKLIYLRFQHLDHPPYSEDLAPSDYHLFPRMKKQLKRRHFSSDAEVIAAAETWLDGQLSFLLLLSLRLLLLFLWLAKVRATSKKRIELRWKNPEFGRCSLYSSRSD